MEADEKTSEIIILPSEQKINKFIPQLCVNAAFQAKLDHDLPKGTLFSEARHQIYWGPTCQMIYRSQDAPQPYTTLLEKTDFNKDPGLIA